MNKGLRQNVISFCRNPLFAGYILFYSYFLKSKRTIFIFIILSPILAKKPKKAIDGRIFQIAVPKHITAA